jgi:putative transposase
MSDILLRADAGRSTITPLVDHVGALRAAFCVTRQEQPFAIDAIVILPDHLHAILSSPADDGRAMPMAAL